MARSDLINSPKFLAPRVSVDYIRERIQLVFEKNQKNLILVVAPAGSGKSTAVAGFINGPDSLWYRIDESDQDIASFFYNFGLLVSSSKTLKKEVLPLFTPDYQDNLAIFSRNYFRKYFSLYKKNGTLVFDNYQNASDEKKFSTVIRIALEEAPDNIVVCLISRKNLPAEFSRLQASNRLFIIDYNTLKLTTTEQDALIDSMGVSYISADERSKIFTETQGWVAGVILYLKQIKGTNNPRLENLTDNRQDIFDYMACELFDILADDEQTVLLKTAYIKSFTVSMVEKITGIKKAKQILNNLFKENYFIIKTENSNYFEYHPLMNEFLIDKVEDILEGDILSDLKFQSAKILEEKQEYYYAANLYIKIEEWESLVTMLLKHAQIFINQGLHVSLGNYISFIPDTYRNNNSWLLYWKGVAELSFNPPAARACFDAAYIIFKNNNDVKGMYLSWSGVIDTFIYEWSSFNEIDSWLEEAEFLQTKFSIFPTDEIAAKFSFGMLAALMYRQPYHKDLSNWAEKVKISIQNIPDTSIRIMMGHLLLLYYNWWKGDMNLAGILVDMLRHSIKSEGLPPLTKIVWHSIEGSYNWQTNSADKSLAMTESGLALATDSGVHLWDFMLYAQCVWASLTKGDIYLAKKYLEKMVASHNHQLTMNVCLYNDAAAIVAINNGESQLALEYAKVALEQANKTGMCFAQAMTHLTNAMANMELDNYNVAARHIVEASMMAEKMESHYVDFLCLFMNGALSVKQKDKESAITLFKKGFFISKRYKLEIHVWFAFDKWIEILSFCLENDVEIEYVQYLIRTRNLCPQKPPLELTNWPWHIKIYTLGRFGIEIGSDSIDISKTNLNKPIEMLKVLLSLGGRDVTEGKISDHLWPDADGDQAHSNFKTTLHRLRKMFGEPHVLQLKNHKLSLNDKYCWVDSWSFSRLIDKAISLQSKNLFNNDMVELTTQLLQIYKGHFLENESSSWAIRLRESLRLQFIRETSNIAKDLEQIQSETSIACYMQLLKLDPFVEIAYQGLIRIYITQGKLVEAQAAYQKCVELLEKTGVKPSIATTQLLL